MGSAFWNQISRDLPLYSILIDWKNGKLPKRKNQTDHNLKTKNEPHIYFEQFQKSQIYTPHFSFEKHPKNKYWSSQIYHFHFDVLTYTEIHYQIKYPTILCQIVQKETYLFPKKTFLNTFIKSDISTLILTPPK